MLSWPNYTRDLTPEDGNIPRAWVQDILDALSYGYAFFGSDPYAGITPDQLETRIGFGGPGYYLLELARRFYDPLNQVTQSDATSSMMATLAAAVGLSPSEARAHLLAGPHTADYWNMIRHAFAHLQYLLISGLTNYPPLYPANGLERWRRGIGIAVDPATSGTDDPQYIDGVGTAAADALALYASLPAQEEISPEVSGQRLEAFVEEYTERATNNLDADMRSLSRARRFTLPQGTPEGSTIYARVLYRRADADPLASSWNANIATWPGNLYLDSDSLNYFAFLSLPPIAEVSEPRPWRVTVAPVSSLESVQVFHHLESVLALTEQIIALGQTPAIVEATPIELAMYSDPQISHAEAPYDSRHNIVNIDAGNIFWIDVGDYFTGPAS